MTEPLGMQDYANAKSKPSSSIDPLFHDTAYMLENKGLPAMKQAYNIYDRSYPGAASDVKAYIWKSMCHPILLYGSECTSLSKLGKQKLETSQANLLKQCLGLSKRCYSTDLLRALNVKRIADTLLRPHQFNFLFYGSVRPKYWTRGRRKTRKRIFS